MEEKIIQIKMLSQYCGEKGTHKAGSVIGVPESEARQLIKGLYAEEYKEPEPEKPKAPAMTEEERAENIKAAVKMILESGNQEKLIASGAPDVRALEGILGFDISADERNAAYEIVKKEMDETEPEQ